MTYDLLCPVLIFLSTNKKIFNGLRMIFSYFQQIQYILLTMKDHGGKQCSKIKKY